MRASEVKVPSKMIHVADLASYGRRNPSDRRYNIFFDSDPAARTLIEPRSKLSNMSRRHSGKVNVLFADGHVASETLKTLTLPQRENMRRWNYDHQPHEEDWWNYPVPLSEWEPSSWEEVEAE